MAYKLKRDPAKEFIKELWGRTELLIRGLCFHPTEIKVVNYHGTQKKNLERFRSHLKFYTRHFNILSPKTFDEAYRGIYHPGKTSLLLTFDDGIRNNLYAADVLREFGIKAWFFIVPAFADQPEGEQEAYLRSHIRPYIDPKLDHEREDLSAMNWTEIKALAREGHAIGSHSYTHELRANHPDHSERIREIAGSRNRISEATGISPEELKGFCCPNDSAYSTGAPEMKLIKEHYHYFFGSYAGSNLPYNPYHIKRSNVEAYMGIGQVAWALNITNSRRWESSIRKFDHLMRDA